MEIIRKHLPVRNLTPDDRYCYFFGYFDKFPCSSQTGHHLAHRVSFQARQPLFGEAADIGYLEDRKFLQIGKSLAWCWQQGSMLQWLNEEEIIFNDVDLENRRHVSRIISLSSGKTRTLDLPVYTLSPDHRFALSLNFSRLDRERPGYGYPGLPDPTLEFAFPDFDGIHLMDLQTGRHRLLISLDQLVLQLGRPEAEKTTHWVNHLLFSPDGKRISFIHRWRVFGPWGRGKRSYITRLMTADTDGNNLQELPADGHFSHYVWYSENRILAASRLHPGEKTQYHIYTLNRPEPEVLAPDLFPPDGHCSVSPDRKWMMTDSYIMEDGCRRLYLYEFSSGKAYEIGIFRSDSSWSMPVRCDLHPRWSPDMKWVSIDSIHEGRRGIYTLDIQSVVSPAISVV